MSEWTFFVDLDGVLADFVGGVARLLDRVPDAKYYDLEKMFGMPENDVLRRIQLAGESFWKALPPYPWAHGLVSHLHVLGETFFCTSPVRVPSCHYGKAAWMQFHFPAEFRDGLFITATRKEKLARKNHVLVDDSLANCERFFEEGGIAVPFPQPWNGEYPYVKVRGYADTVEGLKLIAKLSPAFSRLRGCVVGATDE